MNGAMISDGSVLTLSIKRPKEKGEGKGQQGGQDQMAWGNDGGMAGMDSSGQMDPSGQMGMMGQPGMGGMGGTDQQWDGSSQVDVSKIAAEIGAAEMAAAEMTQIAESQLSQ